MGLHKQSTWGISLDRGYPRTLMLGPPWGGGGDRQMVDGRMGDGDSIEDRIASDRDH